MKQHLLLCLWRVGIAGTNSAEEIDMGFRFIDFRGVCAVTGNKMALMGKLVGVSTPAALVADVGGLTICARLWRSLHLIP